jgi:TolB-like protein
VSAFLYKFKTTFFYFLLCLVLGGVLAGCAFSPNANSADARQNDDEKVIAAVQQLLGSEPPITNSNHLTHFKGLRHGVALRDYADSIAMKFFEQFVPTSGVTVTSFVNYDATLNNTHALGNQLSEALKTSLTHVGYPIVEANLAEQIEITEKGNFVLTRELENTPYEFVVVGTLIHRKHGIDIDTRLLEAKSRKTYAAASLTIPEFLFE